ncbi:hypothetical protein AUG19_01550 [archaeon 13_1_20CM_2_54_9]|nr:MAG: hypothetical protein AUG19_01550 [archaeon 13_1_20CM_2_54_9]
MSAANGPTPQDAVPAMKNGFAQLNNRPIIMTVPPSKVVVAPTTPWWDDREDTDVEPLLPFICATVINAAPADPKR